jgi:prepilin-type N-terminal cleavage/methylation domain-containing protein
MFKQQIRYYSGLSISLANGFTLAEVLITLLIVGIVASIVIPSLIQNTQDAELIAAAKKGYATVQQALLRYKTENGGDYSGLFPAGQSSTYALNQMTPYLNVSKNCGTGTGCWEGRIKYYKPTINADGSYNSSSNPDADSGIAMAILADGTRISFSTAASSSGTTCVQNWSSFQTDANGDYVLDTDGKPIPTSGTYPVCGWINIDINGNKGPNTWGIDVYHIYIHQNRIDGCRYKPVGCLEQILKTGQITRPN